MNDSKRNDKVLTAKVKLRYARALLEHINENPNGLRFKDLREALKIPDSTLFRNLNHLMKEGGVVKAGDLYFPSGGNIALNIFRAAMRIIEETVRLAFLAEEGEKRSKSSGDQDLKKRKAAELKAALAEIADDNNEKSAKLRIAFEEIVGENGYQYNALPSDYDLLLLARLLKYSVQLPLSKLGFEERLSYFIAGAIRYRVEREIGIKEIPVKVLRKVEEYLFENHDVLKLMEEGKKDAVWLNVYEALCLLKDKQIPVILDRILDKVVAEEGDLNNIKHAIRNELWCDKLRETLYNMQYKLFQHQLKHTSSPAVLKFYGDLRRMAIDG
ncbi:hypothetical protein ApAK_07625 [Thermoplasmatales archaeon AK]|nr:hypothetical protein [Thermoplasmatales archaeon AK]